MAKQTSKKAQEQFRHLYFEAVSWLNSDPSLHGCEISSLGMELTLNRCNDLIIEADKMVRKLQMDGKYGVGYTANQMGAALMVKRSAMSWKKELFA